MAKLKVKHVGPIKEGLVGPEAFIEFKGTTLFIGDQGSGKSTLAKLYATLSWIEKALMRGDFSIGLFNSRNGFEKRLAYQGIEGYLSERSVVEYIGEAYHLQYQASTKKLQATLQKESTYGYPKIMYIPAERNFVSAVDKADTITLLPAPLFTFLAEYRAAQKHVEGSLDLPISDIKFRYNRRSETAFIAGKDYEVNLLKASSGFQSMTPLYLVTHYLSNIIEQRNTLGERRLSLSQEEQLRKIADQKEDNWRQAWGAARLKDELQYSNFVNIVEELEQNLYPSSQKKVLFALLGYKNARAADRLVLTTHSLYLLGYLGLCIKAQQLKNMIAQLPDNQQQECIQQLEQLVPINATVDPETLSLYQLNMDGSIENIQSKRGFPMDDNDLNEAMMEANDLFTELLELQTPNQTLKTQAYSSNT